MSERGPSVSTIGFRLMEHTRGPSRPGIDPARIRRVGRRTWRLIRIPFLIWLGLLALFASLQARLIFPGAQTQGQPYALVRPAADCELVTLSTVNGDRVVALFGPALTRAGEPHPEASRRPTLLYFYGNGMCLNDTLEQFDHFRRLGANVLIPDYVGYGMSGGQPSESGCIATADAAYDHLRSRRDVDPRAIVAVGWSLGGAVAIDLASRRPVAGLAAFSTFTSLVEMARRNFPFLPNALLLRHRFDSLANIARVSCPILLMHGKDDRLIPSSMTDRLAASAHAPVTKLMVEGADHNDFFLVGGTQVDEALLVFLEGLPPAP
jgi:uncharacterized protein